MNMLSNYLLRRRARNDAGLSVGSIEDEVVEALNARPEFDPTTNAEHGEVQQRRQNRGVIEEIRADLSRREDEASRHTNPMALNVVIAATLAAEGLGGISLLASTGVEGRYRVVFGLFLALFVVVVTAVVARRVRSTNEPRSIVRSLGTVLTVIGYVLFVATIAILRVLQSLDESTLIEAVLVSLVMSAITIGPAWFVEFLLRLRATSKPLWENMANDRRRIRVLERERAEAEAFVRRIARSQEQWDSAAARIRAAYAAAHRREVARVERERTDEIPHRTEPPVGGQVIDARHTKRTAR